MSKFQKAIDEALEDIRRKLCPEAFAAMNDDQQTQASQILSDAMQQAATARAEANNYKEGDDYDALQEAEARCGETTKAIRGRAGALLQQEAGVDGEQAELMANYAVMAKQLNRYTGSSAELENARTSYSPPA